MFIFYMIWNSINNCQTNNNFVLFFVIELFTLLFFFSSVIFFLLRSLKSLDTREYLYIHCVYILAHVRKVKGLLNNFLTIFNTIHNNIFIILYYKIILSIYSLSFYNIISSRFPISILKIKILHSKVHSWNIFTWRNVP